MGSPFFSVIIPAYNTGRYIKNAVESVMAGGINDFEILIIDDGSTDNTVEIINDLTKTNEHIRFYAENHCGVSHSRNVGLKESRGRFVLFLDSDDQYYPGMLFQLKKILSEKDTDAIIFNGYMGPADNQNILWKFREHGIPKSDGQFTPSNLYCLSACTNCVLCSFKKEILITNNILFNEKISHGEDWLFTIMALLYSRTIYFTNQYFYHYFMYDRGNISSRKDGTFLDFFEAAKKIVFEYKKHGLWETHQYQHYQHLILNASWMYDVYLANLPFNDSKKQRYFSVLQDILMGLDRIYFESILFYSYDDPLKTQLFRCIHSGDWKRIKWWEFSYRYHYVWRIKTRIKAFLCPFFSILKWLKRSLKENKKMKIKNFLKKIWYNLSPNYRSLKRIEAENLQVIDTLKRIEALLESSQGKEK